MSAGASLQVIRDAVRRGRYSHAQSLIADAPPCGERALLESQIAHHLHGNPIEILEKGRRSGELCEPRDLALAAARLASEYLAANERERAIAELDKIPEPLRSDDEVLYYLAAATYMQDRSYAAFDLLARREPADPAMRARYGILRGFAWASNHKFTEQAAATRSALELLLDRCPDEMALIANATHALAAINREIPFPTLSIDLLRRAVEYVDWTEDLEFDHVQSVRAIGWLYALKGDATSAIEYLSLAHSVARTPNYRMLTHLDHAYVAQFYDDEHHFRAHLNLADRSYHAIIGADPGKELASALFTAAELNAERDMGKARFYLNQARIHKGRIDRFLQFAHDRRLDAFCDSALAVILAKDDKAMATMHAKRAFTFFEEIGYSWRAGRVALHLQTLTGESAWLGTARKLLKPYRLNSLRKDIKQRETFADLPPTLRIVLYYLQQGLQPGAIARKMERSRDTVVVHKRRLYKAFDVHSLGELLAKAPPVELPTSHVA